MPYDTLQTTLSTNINQYNTLNTTNILENNYQNRINFSTKSSDTNQLATNNSYSNTNGYGLVNARLAVSKAAGQTPYADAPKLGGNNWGADMIKAPTAWNNGYTGQGTVVAVLDTGVDYNHQDLKNNIWKNSKEIAGNSIDDDGNGYIDDIQGWNFDNNNNNVLDNNGHGTHVSGTIAAENNGIGITGIAYNAKIMPVKVLDSNGSGSYSNIAKGIYYAVDNGANVINLSLGGNSSSDTLKKALEYANSKGVTVVMAAGNNSDPLPSYPARYAYNTGIAVGAVDKNNNLANFSNRSGSEPITYVTAPGVNINSTISNNQYATYSGTSMAAPHIAGVVALMLSANPYLTTTQIRDILSSTSANSTSTPQANPQPTAPTPTQPGLNIPPSLFPPLDSFLPAELINIVNIGSKFPLKLNTQLNTQANIAAKPELPNTPPIIIRIGEDNAKLRIGDIETPSLQISATQYSTESKPAYSFKQSIWDYYDPSKKIGNTFPQPEPDQENDED